MARFLKVSTLTVLVVAVIGSTAQAAIVGTTGNIVQIAPPPSVQLGQLESNDHAVAFDEQQGVTLAANLPVDITVPGTYDDPNALTPGVIPAGTVVNSQFIHSDNVGSGKGTKATFDGSVQVEGDILGISVLNDSLDAGDPLVGAPGTIYPTGTVSRKLALDPTKDIVTFEPDGTTVSVHLETTFHADQIRIISVGQRSGGQGCTPGYWKQPQHFDSYAAPYAPTDQFSAYFEDAFPGLTLRDVLAQGGGGLNALGRHTVAALLNSASPNVSFAFTSQDVIDAFNGVFPGGDYETLKDQFEAQNQSGCPLS
jgi:hypothetical protein